MSLVSKLIATYRRFFPLHQFTAIVSVEIVTNKGSSGSKSKPPWQLCSFLLSHGRVESCPLFWRWTLKVISTWQTLSSKTSVCARSCWWASRCLAVHMDARGWPRVWLLRCFCSGAVYLDCLFFFLVCFCDRVSHWPGTCYAGSADRPANPSIHLTSLPQSWDCKNATPHLTFCIRFGIS